VVILLDFLGFNKKMVISFFKKALNLWQKNPIFWQKCKISHKTKKGWTQG
jgi:hypothetical protein